jgi:hypothetical protein
MHRLAPVLAALGLAAFGPAGPALATTDEDQVRAVLDAMNTSYNSEDFDTFASHLCSDMKQADGFEVGWHQSRRTDGPTKITIYSVDVNGDDAVADVRFAAANQPDAKVLEVDFVRESAQWKACRYDAGYFT